MRANLKLQRLLIVLGACWVGCTGATAPAPPPSGNGDGQAATGGESASTPATVDNTPVTMPLPTISLGGNEPTTGTPPGDADVEQRHRALIEAMQPLQVMLGTWKGTTQREFGDFKALDEPEWVWDFQSEPDQPALAMTSEASPYFSSMRLTYLTDRDEYRLSITEPKGTSRTLTGRFLQPVEEFQGDDKRMHRRYKLELSEEAPADAKDAWQVVFNQQENNRYLVELSRQRGERFQRFDTVAHQRQGTSFALDDTDYGEQACIITGGLGTSTVSYNGKTYWVCCSGCRAAFEENPEKWIAAAANLRKD